MHNKLLKEITVVQNKVEINCCEQQTVELIERIS